MSDSDIATKRATMPEGTNKVLDRRTLERDNKNLLPLLTGNMTVLDVGCGSGSITCGIAKRVADGLVIGIDKSEELISLAQKRFSGVTNLSFYTVDVLNFETEERFDLITAARTMQWIDQREAVLRKMKSLLKDSGQITVLDYNHEKITWTPAVPESVHRFYAAFLKWRSDAGMDNQIADNLQDLFTMVGLKNTSTTDVSEISLRDEGDFMETAGIWQTVAETRGHQLVEDGYLSESNRVEAIRNYQHWMETDAISMKMRLLSVTGRNS